MPESEFNNSLPTGFNSNDNGDDDNDDDHSQEDRNDDHMKRPSQASKSAQEGSGNETATDDSCSSSTEMASEMASSAHMTTTMTLSSEDGGSHCHSHAHAVADVDTRREQLYHQTILMAILTTVSFAAAILTIIPLTTVLALTALATSGGLLSYVTAHRLLLEYQQVIAGDGLVQFLPAGLVQQLTQMSLHQFLRDDTFVREWGFVAIYFVPGLSEEQLNGYIRRLAPHQRNFLTRNGLGHMLGDRFMRVLMGENRWRHATIVGNTIEHPNTHALMPATTPPPTTSSRAIATHQQPPGVVELTVPATTTSTSRYMVPIQGDEGESPDNDGDDNTLDDAGSDLITSAIQDAMWEYARWAGGAAFLLTHDYIIEPTLMFTGSIGLGVSFLSLGAGIWQYNRPSNMSAIQSSSQPSSYFSSAPFLIGSGVIGGVAAGTMIYARTAIRRFVEGGPPIKTTDPRPPKKKKGGRDD